MMYLFLAGIFFVLWYIADKQLKARFNPYLKWGALGIILIFVFYDTYMFIETERLLGAYPLGGVNASISNASCISYSATASCMGVSGVTASGVYISGNNISLQNPDGNYLTILMDIAAPVYEEDINISCAAPELLFKGHSDAIDNEVDINNGTGWVELYAFDTSATDYTQALSLSNYQYVENGVMQFRVLSSAGASNGSSYLYLDQFDTQQTKTSQMYCSNTEDTANVIIYHNTEEAIMPIIMGLLPDLAGFVIVMLIIQVLMIMYDNTMNPKGEADDVIGTDNTVKENLIARRNKEQGREYK